MGRQAIEEAKRLTRWATRDDVAGTRVKAKTDGTHCYHPGKVAKSKAIIDRRSESKEVARERNPAGD